MRYISLFNDRVGTYAGYGYLIVFAVTVFDVAARYLFDSPTVWGLELIILIAGLHYAISGAQGIRNNAHVRIDVIYKLLPRRMQFCMDVLAYSLMFGFLAILVYYGIAQAYPAVLEGERSGAGWNSLAPTYMKVAIPLGALMMALQTVVCLADTFKRIRHEW